jgi:putative tryptophan/tyrosine transport system substrate-binding protein
MLDTRRRQFIRLLGGPAAAWPLAAKAQQPTMPVIGYLHSGSFEASAPYLAAFRKGLSDTGFVEGRNVAIEYRWAEGHYERMPEVAADLVRRKVAVIATPGNLPGTRAAKAATSTIPIVFGVAEDPVKAGLVASLSRPEGNATGINFFTGELVAKRLALLHELVPSAKRVAVFINPADAQRAEVLRSDVQAAARDIRLELQVLDPSTIREIDTAFVAIVRERAEALFVGPDGFYNSRRVQLATPHRNLQSRYVRERQSHCQFLPALRVARIDLVMFEQQGDFSHCSCHHLVNSFMPVQVYPLRQCASVLGRRSLADRGPLRFSKIFCNRSSFVVRIRPRDRGGL